MTDMFATRMAQGIRIALAFVLAAAFGAVTEVQQHFIPSRSMEFGDFLADAGGA